MSALAGTASGVDVMMRDGPSAGIHGPAMSASWNAASTSDSAGEEYSARAVMLAKCCSAAARVDSPRCTASRAAEARARIVARIEDAPTNPVCGVGWRSGVSPVFRSLRHSGQAAVFPSACSLNAARQARWKSWPQHCVR
eukprot:scaffold69608_cov30-Tisochrysis_lutea.AAC.2